MQIKIKIQRQDKGIQEGTQVITFLSQHKEALIQSEDLPFIKGEGNY